MEPRAIAAIVEKIARSPLSVSAYFKRHKLPFGRSRYFQYKAQLAANGLDGLVDGRSGGNRRELTAHAQGFIRGVHQENPQLSLRQIADRVESSCGIRVSRMTVSRCLLAAGLKVQWPRPGEDLRATLCLRGGQAQRQELLAHGVVPERRVRCGAQVFGHSRPATDHVEWPDAFGEQPARQCAGTLLRLQLPASHAG